ncbi:hypothetical protein I350_07272 [Cryptococcus amylolentus CBS 6273]|uniref:GP-PDE domain-containing protein n=1 Tax=Cryptococcus amylolentus CBS 6273 TaxID=1296118 RepID=A0A1E3JE48_9TREE|nr:hypothetical protein I350_07272 [Cryptococcus amylolentus CBS 6273]
MARIITSYKNHETDLSPRIILGLWHPLFIRPAVKYLPACRRFYIGFSIQVAKQYFWDTCEGFSISFPFLMGQEGQAFVKECREKGKEVTAWTVNDVSGMKAALSMGLKAVLTDEVGVFVNLKHKIAKNPESLQLQGLERWTFPWSNWKYYSAGQKWILRTKVQRLQNLCYQPGPSTLPNLSDLDTDTGEDRSSQKGGGTV